MNHGPCLGPAPCSCGCCVGIEAATPRRIDNRPGLSAVAYRIGEHAHFRASLVAGLSSSRFPPLAALRTREPADFTIGLLDAVACAADVLTFYQERLANESWLRTATERVSLQEMGRLIGHRLRPGVAAETRLAFALEPPKAPPPGATPDPGAFVTGIPTALTLVAGLAVQSVPAAGEKPQTFETVETIEARPEWNALRAATSTPSVAGAGATDAWVRGVDTNLKPGDWVAIVGAEFDASAASPRWDARRLTTVEPDAAGGRTRLAWADPIANASPDVAPAVPPTLHAFRQRAAIFGHNAPLWRAMSDEFRLDYLGPSGEDTGEWPDFEIRVRPVIEIELDPSPLSGAGGVGGAGGLGAIAIGSGASTGLGGAIGDIVVDRTNPPVSLDAPYPRIVPGGLALLVRGGDLGLYRIGAVTETSRAAFAIAGKSTGLRLSGSNLARFDAAVRDLSVFVQSERLVPAARPRTDDATGAAIDVTGDATTLPVGRRLVVRGERADTGAVVAHDALLVAVASGAAPDTTRLSIDPALPHPLRRDSVVVHANVALATHGETVTEVLGSGQASVPFQRFELKRLPLTHRAARTETGADSELFVRVGEVEWAERATLFDAGPGERVYALETDVQGRAWVVFGDGVRGARLPSGVNNVRATYRQGLGAAGNVAADRLVQLKTRPPGLKGVANPSPAEGGTDPEPADQARRGMPLGTRTLGRVVSLLDYEDFALAFAGIAKAQAQVLTLAAGPAIAITLAADDGEALGAANPVRANLQAALRTSGDPHVQVLLLDHAASTFRIGLKVRRDPAWALDTVLAAVEAALRARYAFDARALGQPVLQSEVIATAQAVPGVVAVDLDWLWGGTASVAQGFRAPHRRLLAQRMRVVDGAARPAELLTLHPGPLARLEEMP